MRGRLLQRLIIAILTIYLCWAGVRFIQSKSELARINQQISQYDTLLAHQRLISLNAYSASWDVLITEFEAARDAAPFDRQALAYHMGQAYAVIDAQGNIIEAASTINHETAPLPSESSAESHIFDALYAYLKTLRDVQKRIDQEEVSAADIQRDLTLLIHDTRIVQSILHPDDFIANRYAATKESIRNRCAEYQFTLLHDHICNE
jgi:hypothetical protein